MNSINEALDRLKAEARRAGRNAGAHETEFDQDMALIAAYGRNVRAAHLQAKTSRWFAEDVATLLNNITTKAFTGVVGERSL